MKIFFYCAFSILFAWLIHLFIWRIALPKKHTKCLIAIFLSVLALTCFVGVTSSTFHLTWPQLLNVVVFYIPVMLAYVCFYSAIEENSPSVSLISLTAKNQVCRFEDYLEIVNDRLLTESRLPAMVRDGLLTQKDEHYQLTPKGWYIARLFSFTNAFFKFSDAG